MSPEAGFQIPEGPAPVIDEAFRRSVIERLTAAQQEAAVSEAQETEAKPNLDAMSAFKGLNPNDLLAEVLNEQASEEKLTTQQLDELRERAIESSRMTLLGDLLR